jgi:hypothetical protein
MTAACSMRLSEIDDPDDVDLVDLVNEDIPFDWIVPGLLAKGERMVLTAGEGLGKSTLLRQFAVCAAAGLHPPATGTGPAGSTQEERHKQPERK